MSGRDIDTTIDNYDELAYQWTKPKVAKTRARAVLDSYKAGDLGFELGKVWADIGEQGGMKKADPFLAQEAMRLIREIEDRQEDIPRGALMYTAKAVAQTMPYSIEGAKGAAFGNALAALLPGGMPKTALALGKWAAGAIGQGIATYKALRGMEYAEMMQNGVADDIAWDLSGSDAFVQAGIEGALDSALGLVGRAAGGGANLGTKLANRLTRQIMRGGKMSHIGRMLTDLALRGAGEFVEEGAQSLASSAYAAVGRDETKQQELRGIVEDIGKSALAEYVKMARKENLPESAGEAIEKAVVEGLNGFLVGAVMGGFGAVGTQIKSISDAAKIREIAGTFSPETAKELIKGYGFSIFDGMDEAAVGGAIDEALAAAQKRREASAGETPPAPQGETPPPPPGAARRLPGGELYYEIKDNGSYENTEKHRLLVGDPGDGEKEIGGDAYAAINYRKEDGKIFVEEVNRYKSLEDSEQIVMDAMVALANDNPGLQIEWEPANPMLQKVRERLIDENPLGAQGEIAWGRKGVSPERVKDLSAVYNEFRKLNLGGEDLALAAELAETVTRNFGMNLGSAIRENMFGAMTEAELRANPEIARQIPQALSPDVSGAQFFVTRQGGGIIPAAVCQKRRGRDEGFNLRREVRKLLHIRP
jgi:hypothetical protein